MKRINPFEPERESKRVRNKRVLDSWNHPIGNDASLMFMIPDMWIEIFKHIDMKQVWVFLFVSKDLHKWICFHLTHFDSTRLYRFTNLPICQNMFPNIRHIKFRTLYDKKEKIWNTIPDKLLLLETIDIDFEIDNSCPAMFLDWIRLSPDEFETAGNSFIDIATTSSQKPRPIKKLIMRNKTGHNKACLDRYKLLQVEHLEFYDCNFDCELFSAITQSPNIQTITMYLNNLFVRPWVLNGIMETFKNHPNISFIFYFSITNRVANLFIRDVKKMKNVKAYVV